MILVTGGAGFIGASLVSSLAAVGLDPVALDNLSGGDPGNLSARVSLIEADVADPGVLDTVAGVGPEAMVHAAAQVNAASSVAEPGRDREVNVEGTANVISGSKRAGALRLVFLSSGGAV